MKKQSGFLRRSIILALSLLCILTALTAVSFAADIISYGYCGEGKGLNLYWELDSDGILTISGTGKMADFGDDSNYCPWEYFSNDIKSVNIQNGVTSIGDCAFLRCDRIRSVTIPNSVTRIGKRAFEECRFLTSITLPNSIKRIEDYLFSKCSSLTNIVIPNSVESIGEYAFFDAGLDSITIPPSVTSIGKMALWRCYVESINVSAGNPVYDSRNNCNAIIETQSNTLVVGCKNTVIPNTVTNIGEYALSRIGFTSVIIPGNVKKISAYAFEGCQLLSSVTISDGVSYIDHHAFTNCAMISELFIPNSVLYIGKNAFESSMLNSICVGSGNPKYDSRNGCNALIETQTNTLLLGCKKTIIPNSVLSIGESAFNYCSGLTGIVIPSSVTSIGENAFFGCSGLKSVIIPSSVTYLGDYAFSYAYFLEDAFFCGNVPDMTPDVFEKPNKNRFTIHYTADSTGWTDSDAYDMKLGTWNGYKLALWDGQSVQIQQATPQSVTIHVQNKEEAYVYAAIYENGRFVKTVCKLVPVNAGEVMLTLGLDELPEGAVIKAFVLAADGKVPLAKNAVWIVR